MSTNWQGSERKSRAPISLTDTEPEAIATDPATIIHAVPDAEAAATEPKAETVVVDHREAPLVSGRRSAAVLRKENVNDQLPPATGWQAFLRAVSFGLISPKVGTAELARRADLSAIQRVYSRPMQITVASPPWAGWAKRCAASAWVPRSGSTPASRRWCGTTTR